MCPAVEKQEERILAPFHPFFSFSAITPHFPCFLPVMLYTVWDKNKMVFIHSREKGRMLCQD